MREYKDLPAHMLEYLNKAQSFKGKWVLVADALYTLLKEYKEVGELDECRLFVPGHRTGEASLANYQGMVYIAVADGTVQVQVTDKDPVKFTGTALQIYCGLLRTMRELLYGGKAISQLSIDQLEVELERKRMYVKDLRKQYNAYMVELIRKNSELGIHLGVHKEHRDMVASDLDNFTMKLVITREV